MTASTAWGSFASPAVEAVISCKYFTAHDTACTLFWHSDVYSASNWQEDAWVFGTTVQAPYATYVAPSQLADLYIPSGTPLPANPPSAIVTLNGIRFGEYSVTNIRPIAGFRLQLEASRDACARKCWDDSQ